MQPAKMLPVDWKNGETFSQWAEKWLYSIAADMASIVQNDAVLLRERNERFSSYLPTLTNIKHQYIQKVDDVKAEFKSKNPREEKETKTAYEERIADATRQYRRMVDWIDELHQDIAARLSNGQTSARTLGDQVKHGT